MRLGIDTLFESPVGGSGGQVTLINFVRELNRGGYEEHDIFLFVSRSNRHLYPVRRPNLHHVVYPVANERRLGRLLEQQLLIPYHCARLRLDVLNSPGNIGTLAAPCASVLKIQTNQHLLRPTDIGWLRARVRQTLIPLSARRAAAIIVNSESLRRDVLEHLDIHPERVRVVYDCLDVDFFAASTAEPREAARERLRACGIHRPFILYVSSLWPYKNPEQLLRAFGLLVRNGLAEHELVFVGSGARSYEHRLKVLSASLGIGDRVRWVGRIEDREAVRTFYRVAEVLVYPSLAETFGLPPLEAMACGTPVVAANRTAIPEIVGDAALLVDPDDTAALAAAIERVLEHGALRDELARRGHERCREFTCRRMVEDTLRVLTEVARA
jgi:glycosyltransferase involved in cell wall biosynthesis